MIKKMEKNSTNTIIPTDETFPVTPRYLAVKVLNRYERSDSYVDKLLNSERRHSNLNSYDMSLMTELVNGVIRWRNKLDWCLTGFYRGDFQKCLNIVKNAMRVALYQIVFLTKIPAYSAVNESVEIVKRIQGEKTAGIVNGVLRNLIRNLDNVRYPERDDDIVYHLSVMYSHPKWMIKRWIERFGAEETEMFLTYNNHRPNIPLRVNLIRSNVDEIIEYLRANEIKHYRTPYLQQSLRIKISKTNVIESDLFKDGKFTVQDTSASMAVVLANPKPGQKIVDLCAAPGGKSFFLAELSEDQAEIIAIDKYESKLRFIEEGAERLGFRSIRTLVTDAREYEPEEKPDLLFLDVPCSGLGTLSKRPDIKWKREHEDLLKLVKTQREILKNAARIIGSGGVILYSTCTTEPEENEENIKWFLEEHPDFEIDPAEKYLPLDVCKDGFMQTFPHHHNCDGAFAARLIKRQSDENIY